MKTAGRSISRYTDVNPALEEITGLSRDDIVGKTLAELYAQIRIFSGPFEGEDLVDIGKAALEGRSDTYLVHNPVSGKYLHMTAFKTDERQIGIFSTDETDRILSAQALRESEERLRSLFVSMTNGLMLLDVVRDAEGNPVQYIVSSCNPAYAKYFGVPEEEVIGLPFLDYVKNLRVLSHDFGDRWWTGIDDAAGGVTGTYHVYHDDPVAPPYQEVIIFPCGENKVGLLTYDETGRIESERALRESEERHRLLFDSITNGVLLLDVVRDGDGKPVDYIVAECNPAFEAGIHRTREEMVGRSLLQLIKAMKVSSHDFGDRWWTGLETAAGGFSGTYHTRIEEFQPSPFQEVVVFPAGRDRVGVLMYDETYRIRTEQTLRMMQFIIDHISEPVFWLFFDGTIQYANNAAATSLGYESAGVTPDGPVGVKAWQYDSSVTEENWLEFLERMKDEKTLRFETVFHRADGSTFPALVVADLLEQNGEPFIAACFHDMSEQIRRIEAEQAALAKSRFLDHMTHEIRTPLNGVIGIADILLGTALTPKQREYVELARTSGRHLLALVNNILDFSRLQRGTIDLEHVEFDLSALVESILDLLATQASERQLELCGLFRTDVPRHVFGDPGRLRQVLINLLGNGLKFTSSGGVRLVVSTAPDAPEDASRVGIRFEVIDTGIGMTPEVREKLFESFTLGDVSYARKYGGTGLGLVIVRELVELMGGRIEVESETGVGSIFRFTVPLETSDRKTTVQNTFRHGKLELANRSVVVVVENAVLRDLLVQLFKSWGMTVRACKRKEEALSAVREAAERHRPYQMIVVDDRLEDGSGMELVEAVKREPEWAETSVILLTPLGGDLSKTRQAIDQVDRIVTKPVFGSTLFNAVLGLVTGTDEQPDLPGDPSPAAFPDSPIDPEDTDRQTPHILVVEDNRINQIVVAEILSRNGLTFDVAENGAKACEAVAAKPYDLILMDCQMPIMDGFEATRTIRDMEAGLTESKPQHSGRIPIVALTANAMPGDKERCLEAGMDAFCAKPVDAEKLIDVIRQFTLKTGPGTQSPVH